MVRPVMMPVVFVLASSPIVGPDGFGFRIWFFGFRIRAKGPSGSALPVAPCAAPSLSRCRTMTSGKSWR